MNDGYFFMIICWILLILIWTHWLDPFWQMKRNKVKTRQLVLLFLLLIISMQAFYIPLYSKISVNVGSVLVLGGLALYFLWRDESDYRWQFLSVILFLGIFYGVAYEVFVLDPILMVISPFYMLPAFLALFLLLSTTNLKLQCLMMVGGFVLGELIHKLFMLQHVERVFIGDAGFRDQLALGLIMVTSLNLLSRLCYRIFKQAVRLFTSQGEQEG
jgi:hypothetical protein